ncbi:MAG: acetylornithine deacetylase [Alphaproteobacteria bacterium]|nr:acetylornithine deacetylase [Alphaproteobacteria bacterium]
MSKQVEEVLARLVSFDTTSSKPNRACIEYVRDYLNGHGVSSEIVTDESGDKACLWATVGSGSSGIVLAGHTDVVPVEGQHWTSDPFKLADREGKLYGRGAADMKGFLACALAMVPEALASKDGGGFHLALTSDEETDMLGAVRLVDFLGKKGVRPNWVWLGEPTGLDMIDRHKGCSAFLTRIEGVPCHSSQPDKGLNAIELTAELIRILMDMYEERKARPVAGSTFDPPYTTLNMGTIKGGTAENITAEFCELLWQVRVHPGETASEILAEATQKAQERFKARFEAHAPKAGMETTSVFDLPPFLGAAENAAIKSLKTLRKEAKIYSGGFATEAGFFEKLGADVAICGPGYIEQAHQPDEFIEKSQLLSCVDLMRQVLLSSSPRNERHLNRSPS